MRLRVHMTVRASGAAGLGACAERLVDDGLDGAGASAAFSAATEAAIDLLGITRQILRRADGAADILITKDVAGTDNHTNASPTENRAPSILKTPPGCKRKNRLFK